MWANTSYYIYVTICMVMEREVPDSLFASLAAISSALITT